jgi:ubiquinone/menaquinone biosynthesis C-methylase UbiE
MDRSSLFHPSSNPAGRGITLGTPGRYELFTALMFVGRGRSYRPLLKAAGVSPGERALDVGCGPGYFARMLARAVGPEGSVIGVDAAPEMVEYAARKAGKLPNCRFEAGTAEALSFPDASFDVVVSSLMLHHLPEEARQKAVAEMARVLRPGGRLVLAEFTIPERGAWRHFAQLTRHANDMARGVPEIEPLVAAAGFTGLRTGDSPPWLHYVRATRP